MELRARRTLHCQSGRSLSSQCGGCLTQCRSDRVVQHALMRQLELHDGRIDERHEARCGGRLCGVRGHREGHTRAGQEPRVPHLRVESVGGGATACRSKTRAGSRGHSVALELLGNGYLALAAVPLVRRAI